MVALGTGRRRVGRRRLRPRFDARAGALIVICIAAACDGRDRANPLDPRNEETRGRPDWLRAVADDRAVDLSWRSAPPIGLVAYVMNRSTADGVFVEFARIEDPLTTALRDSGRTNGVPHRYRLDIVIDDGETIGLPEKSATPGAVVVWALENAPRGLVRASPDARDVRFRGGPSGIPFDAECLPDGSAVWVADYFGGVVAPFDRDGARTGGFRVEYPFRVAVDPVRSRVWVGSYLPDRGSTLRAFDFAGGMQGEFPIAGEILDLAVDVLDGACFVARGAGRGVARAAVGDTVRSGGGDVYAVALAVDSGDRVWVADPLNRAIHALDVESLEALVTIDGLEPPRAITLDSDRHLWAATGSDAILRLAPEGTIARALAGHGSVAAVAWDGEVGALWLAQIAQNRLLRLVVADESVSAVALFQPFHVTVGLPEAPPRSGRSTPDVESR
jgi:sugar lactone lactonase YvrE